MGKFETERAKAAKARHARERESEPINSASYAAVALRGHLPTGPSSSTQDTSQETPEDYQGGRSNDIGVPSAAGELP